MRRHDCWFNAFGFNCMWWPRAWQFRMCGLMASQTRLHPHCLERDPADVKREREESAKRYAQWLAEQDMRRACQRGKHVDTWRYDAERPGVRYEQRTAPLWMEMNMHDGRCWCGRPRSEFEEDQRKYCCGAHRSIWWLGAVEYWSSFRYNILLRDDYTCAECGRRAPDYMEVDHMLPLALGGACYDEANLQTLCGVCHKKKTRKDARNIGLRRRKMNAQAFAPDGSYRPRKWHEVYGAPPPW